MRFWRSFASGLALAGCACSSGAARVEAQPAATPVAQDPALPPPGFGTLRQDQVGIRLQSTTLSIRVLPLDERVTRLLAPDAYQSLREMKQSRADAIGQAARTAGFDSVTAFMVTFFAQQPQARFTPDLLNIASQNVTYRPIGVVPITPRFSEGVIEQRQQQAAIYLFDPSIPIGRPFTVTYETLISNAWSDVLHTLNAERARVLARAQQPAQP
jgi:hypothetical protein